MNIGDTDVDTFRKLKRQGVTGVYHVCRINEGVDTKLNKEEQDKDDGQCSRSRTGTLHMP
ncbi:MAG: hypothetical protein V8Q42_07460 [Anaerovoracaceae bacterium]